MFRARLIGGRQDGQEIDLPSEVDVVRTTMTPSPRTGTVYEGYLDDPLLETQVQYVYTGTKDGVRLYTLEKLLEL